MVGRASRQPRRLIAEHRDGVVGERGPGAWPVAQAGLEVVVGEGEARLVGKDVVDIDAIARWVESVRAERAPLVLTS